ncbi:penicillin-binding protein activator [Oharaeibacter diazotrophicus]|uniref:Amino acid/amide ABC transporter substrate-binding protein (HAAT family) n=1 Tax=Oharaeibacter diazotrophicus TaxID=1920512 RepID=A0A4R6RGR0_9HYPH|nr:penicillin-binding protein activator [Oharaeibacter diazotrophicus]TDP84987.1 amino acid/amide ABC transporter substrate-binding protein (HAAT family) [Oharaeibacter diazotrophicus]BBE73956.1 LppC putative lipoprotein [Pleomorphomonas sp. SM30]GLS76357.1 penicillin-binding protein activator [Oharaeibacter diazotrophicus]
MSEYERAAGSRPAATGRLTRRSVLTLFGGTAMLAGCSPTTGPSGPSVGGGQLLPAPVTPTAPTGEVIGSGSVRVALLLPKSAGGNGAAVAATMRNAAQLALSDFVGNDVTLMVKDTGGTPEGAARAATAAVAERAELILGPLFAAEVKAVAPVALGANVPVISFSSDPSAASSGVYVMGFMVDDQVRQVVSYAASQGRRSLAAIVSDGAYGTLAEAALRESAARSGARIIQVERAAAGNVAAAAAAVAANAVQLDALFVPDGPGFAPAVADALKGNGVDLSRVKLLGTGVWNDPAVYSSPSLAGGWFPVPDLSGYQSFAGRYRASFGGEPQQVTSLAYDAVVLAAGLVKAAGAQRFQRNVLTNPDGFLSAVNGLFRFNADGTNDRGLAIYEATAGGPKLLQPAPRSFAGA